ncbi:integrase/recombinase XerC [Chitinophaga costaii]|uniref:Integrase/recombinase XerC n=1 Tax=Chitinophaga costaii TaxID=1335309 RepID=A0A1C3ZP80_9BACT|nr:tyrosine-type recombinase/integrase [Chitinophaga costaii]PUZ30455.1 integrase [Chitinophaga costaii]SCB84224.1 integrase/recombinase XerC [Chitinophaga costaii]
MTELQDFVARFQAYLRFEKRYSTHTVTAYCTDLQQFQDFIAITYGLLPVADIGHVHIRTWLAGLMASSISAKSINRKISTLKSFFKFIIRQGALKQSPMVKVVSPKTGRRLPEFIDEKGMQALEENRSPRAGEETHLIFTDDLEGQTHRLIFDLLYNTGIRLSELIGLQEKDVDLGHEMIKVLGKGGKERRVPVSSVLCTQIKDYLVLRRKIIASEAAVLLLHPKSGKPLYPKYVYNMVRGVLTRHNVTTISRKSPHILRHTFATHLTNNGADINAVKELLGHASLAATQVYTHNTIEKLKAVHQQAHPKA